MCEEEEDGELEIFFIILSSFVLVDVFEKKNLERKGRPKPRNQEEKKEEENLVSLAFTHKNKRSTHARTRKGRSEYSAETKRETFKRERERSAHISRPALKTKEKREFLLLLLLLLYFPFLKSEKKIPFESKEK